MKKGLFLIMILLTILGCNNKTLNISEFEAQIENTSIKAIVFDIKKDEFLLVIEDKKYEAYYINVKEKIFGFSSLSKFKYLRNEHKAIVNKSALGEPPIIGQYKADFMIEIDYIEILVKEPVMREYLDIEMKNEVDYAKHMALYQKRILLKKKTLRYF